MIVVSGAFGKTGSAVAKRIEAAGASVRRLTRNPAHLGKAPGVVLAALGDESALNEALRGAQAAYLILPDDLCAERFHAERRAIADNVAQVVRQQRVPRVVLLSSTLAALGEGQEHGFGADLAYFEHALLQGSAAVSILRASYFLDNVLQAVPVAQANGVYPNCFASRERALPTIAASDVGDLAAQVLLARAPTQHEIFDLLGPAYSANEIAQVLGEAVGRKLDVVDVGIDQQMSLFRQAMSAEAAQAMVSTLACLSSGRALPRSARALHGETSLTQVLVQALGAARRRS